MGTAAVMLGAALSLFAFVGTLVSFGAWPGLSAHENVDSLLVESVSTSAPEPLRVSERPRTPVARAPVRDASGPAAAAPPAAAPRGAVPIGRAPGPQAGSAPAPAPAPGGGRVPATGAPAPAAPRPVERVAGEVNRTVETVTQQTNEIVGEVGGQLQAPVENVDRAVNGLGR